MKRLDVTVRIFFLLLAASIGTARGAVPQEFAFGLEIVIPQGGSVYALDLPVAVYTGLTRPDLGDMRVFNGRGEEVPFTLRRPRLVMGEAPSPRALPVFALYAEAASEADLSLRVRTNEDGAILEMQSGRTVEGEQPVAYLLDLVALAQRPTALDLSWRAATNAKGFLARVNVFSSNDLVQWTPIVTDATIGDLGYGHNRLQRNRVILPPFSGRYLRLDWPEVAQSTMVDGIQAQFVAPASYPRRQWLPLEGKRKEKKPDNFYFSGGAFFPTDCVRILPREANTVARVRLFSRTRSDGPWRVRVDGLVYNLMLESEPLTSEPFCFPPVTDPFWRLEAAEEGGGFGFTAPSMELGWNPHRLLFVARGPAPFTLAYGSARQGPASAAMDPLLQDLEANHPVPIKSAESGRPYLLGGAARLKAESTIPWRRMLLWAVLAGGVVVLAWMARHLAREMKRPPA